MRAPDHDLGAAYHAEITLKNTEWTTSENWTVSWDLAPGQQVQHWWSADVTTSGTTATARNLTWNGDVRSGASTTFGFLASGGHVPERITCAVR